MSLLLISRDLATASRVEGAALRQRQSLRTVAGSEQAVAICGEGGVTLAIVDLTTASLDVAALVRELRANSPSTRIVAFGPHVHEAVLEAARLAGCDEVVTRGQFFAQLDSVVQAAGLHE
jgi:CheY-like chemotaxis protein